MLLTADIILQGVVLALASGRVGYSLVNDEIFRKLREWIWLRSAPVNGTIRHFNEDGSWQERPAAFYQEVEIDVPSAYIIGGGEPTGTCMDWDKDTVIDFAPDLDVRPARFLGQVFECHFCMTFWTSLLASIGWLAHPEFAVIMATPFAMWAVANLYAQRL